MESRLRSEDDIQSELPRRLKCVDRRLTSQVGIKFGARMHVRIFVLCFLVKVDRGIVMG
jgi:hypothetical protein